MEPIISPWLIWAIQSCGNVKGILTGCSIVSAIVFAGLLMVIGVMRSDDGDECLHVDYSKEIKRAKRIRNIAAIVMIPTLIISALMPDKETATLMAVSSYITEDNINAVADGTKEAIDYLFDKIEGLVTDSKS